jgi:hypothetical protein
MVEEVEKYEYEVTFRLEKTVRVKAFDEIQAELEAAARLSPAQQKRVHEIRVISKARRVNASSYIDFYKPDKSFWQEGSE